MLFEIGVSCSVLKVDWFRLYVKSSCQRQTEYTERMMLSAHVMLKPCPTFHVFSLWKNVWSPTDLTKHTAQLLRLSQANFPSRVLKRP